MGKRMACDFNDLTDR